MRDNLPAFEEKNVTIIGVSPDASERLAEWREAENLPYRLLSDPDHVVAEQYNAWGEKSMYGKTYMGIIRSHFLIDADGKFEDVQLKVSPKKSIEKAVKAVS